MTEPSTVTIVGIPTSIKRADYVALIESVGFDVRDLVDLHFGLRAITATVKARNSEGKHYLDPNETNAIAKHHIVIPIEDE